MLPLCGGDSGEPDTPRRSTGGAALQTAARISSRRAPARNVAVESLAPSLTAAPATGVADGYDRDGGQDLSEHPVSADQRPAGALRRVHCRRSAVHTENGMHSLDQGPTVTRPAAETRTLRLELP